MWDEDVESWGLVVMGKMVGEQTHVLPCIPSVKFLLCCTCSSPVDTSRWDSTAGDSENDLRAESLDGDRHKFLQLLDTQSQRDDYS